MNNFWKVIEIISTFCSIIGLPVALFQLSGLKTKSKATEEELNKLLEMKAAENLDQILLSVSNQQKELLHLQIFTEKEGTTPKAIHEKCEKIINELNICILNLSVKYDTIIQDIKSVIEYLHKYLNSNDKKFINDAFDCIYIAIKKLKQEKELYTQKQLKGITK